MIQFFFDFSKKKKKENLTVGLLSLFLFTHPSFCPMDPNECSLAQKRDEKYSGKEEFKIVNHRDDKLYRELKREKSFFTTKSDDPTESKSKLSEKLFDNLEEDILGQLLIEIPQEKDITFIEDEHLKFSNFQEENRMRAIFSKKKIKKETGMKKWTRDELTQGVNFCIKQKVGIKKIAEFFEISEFFVLTFTFLEPLSKNIDEKKKKEQALFFLCQGAPFDVVCHFCDLEPYELEKEKRRKKIDIKSPESSLDDIRNFSSFLKKSLENISKEKKNAYAPYKKKINNIYCCGLYLLENKSSEISKKEMFSWLNLHKNKDYLDQKIEDLSEDKKLQFLTWISLLEKKNLLNEEISEKNKIIQLLELKKDNKEELDHKDIQHMSAPSKENHNPDDIKFSFDSKIFTTMEPEEKKLSKDCIMMMQNITSDILTKKLFQPVKAYKDDDYKIKKADEIIKVFSTFIDHLSRITQLNKSILEQQYKKNLKEKENALKNIEEFVNKLPDDQKIFKNLLKRVEESIDTTEKIKIVKQILEKKININSKVLKSMNVFDAKIEKLLKENQQSIKKNKELPEKIKDEEEKLKLKTFEYEKIKKNISEKKELKEKKMAEIQVVEDTLRQMRVDKKDPAQIKEEEAKRDRLKIDEKRITKWLKINQPIEEKKYAKIEAIKLNIQQMKSQQEQENQREKDFGTSIYL